MSEVSQPVPAGQRSARRTCCLSSASRPRPQGSSNAPWLQLLHLMQDERTHRLVGLRDVQQGERGGLRRRLEACRLGIVPAICHGSRSGRLGQRQLNPEAEWHAAAARHRPHHFVVPHGNVCKRVQIVFGGLAGSPPQQAAELLLPLPHGAGCVRCCGCWGTGRPTNQACRVTTMMTRKDQRNSSSPSRHTGKRGQQDAALRQRRRRGAAAAAERPTAHPGAPRACCRNSRAVVLPRASGRG